MELPSNFPSYRFHVSGRSTLIQNPEQEPQGPDWSDKPWPQQAALTTPACESCETLKREIESIRAKFNKAWDGLLAERDQLQERYDALAAEHAQTKQEEAPAPVSEIPEAKTRKKK
jgi:hypothetical protein